ncbi:MAG TPA: hypothetical protein PLA19_01430 [Candidatus Pacearchaeota archaeon]|nr:hypothetical protein [Candidatus Pacearchaeota archaeon]
MNKFAKIIIDALFTVVLSCLFINFALAALYMAAIYMPESVRNLSIVISLVGIGFIVWAIFRSKTDTVIKAASSVALLEVVSVAIGAYFSGQMKIIYLLNTAVAISSIYCLHRAKASWQYYLAVILFYLWLGFLLVPRAGI